MGHLGVVGKSWPELRRSGFKSSTYSLCDPEQVPNPSDAHKVQVKVVKRCGSITHSRFNEAKVSLSPKLNYLGFYLTRICGALSNTRLCTYISPILERLMK